MTTITAVPNAANGTITLTVVKTEAITGIVRADANGTRLVRAPAGAFPAGTSGTLTIVDHEASLDGPIYYRTGTATPVLTAFPAGLLPRVTIPLQPSVAVWVENVHGYDAARETSGTVHERLGAEFPIVVEGEMRSRRGTLEIIVRTHLDALELVGVLKRGKTNHLRQTSHKGLDMYFYALTAKEEPTEGLWKVSVDYVEVDVPVGDRAADGSWTFANLAALPGATFNTVPSTYESFTDLAVNQAATS